MEAVPLTFYWRGRVLRVTHDDPTLNLYSPPIGVLRRAMARSEGTTSLELALRASLGASYAVAVHETREGVVVDLRRRTRA